MSPAPLVRARIVEYLAARVVTGVRRYNGQVPLQNIDTAQMAHDLGVSPHDINEGLWNLQKQQVVTFKERKGPKGSVLSHFRLADTALKGMPVETIAKAVATEEEVMNQAIDIVSVAHEMSDEAIQRHTSTPCTNRRGAPEWCVEHDSLWPRGDLHCAAEWERRNPGPDEDEPGASSQNLDAATDSPEVIAHDDLPAILVPPTLDEYPEVQFVIKTLRGNTAIERAAETLMEAGIDGVADDILARIIPMSPLDTEVIRLATVLGWMDEEGQPK